LRDLYGYARVLPNAVFAFYESSSPRRIKVDEIVTRPVLFKVPVMNSAVTSGRWKVIGNIPLCSELQTPPSFFVQDAIHKERFSISRGGKQRPATAEECVGLERLAVWSAQHIEDRLRDAHAGKPNKWVESLRMKL
jgi:hypothetical protein